MSTFTLALLGALAYLGWRHYRTARELTLARQVAPVEDRTGHYVEVDCAACHAMNRVPAARLRSRPICGKCKVRLLSGRKITICHVRNLDFDPALRRALDDAAKDYDRFWATLDVYFKRRATEAAAAAGRPADVKDLLN